MNVWLLSTKVQSLHLAITEEQEDIERRAVLEALQESTWKYSGFHSRGLKSPKSHWDIFYRVLSKSTPDFAPSQSQRSISASRCRLRQSFRLSDNQMGSRHLNSSVVLNSLQSIAAWYNSSLYSQTHILSIIMSSILIAVFNFFIRNKMTRFSNSDFIRR